VPGRTQTLVPNPHAFERKKDRRQIQGERNFFKRTVLGLVRQRGAYSFANFLFLRLNYMPASEDIFVDISTDMQHFISRKN
jgi:hypothetical protein